MNALFIDTFDLYRRLKKKFDGKLDYESILDHFEPKLAFAYGMAGDGNRAFVGCLKKLEFTTRFKKSHNFRGIIVCDWGVQLALDIAENYEEIDTAVLGTCSLQVLPIIRWLKARGIAVTILGVDVPQPLIDAADQVVEITEEMLECD